MNGKNLILGGANPHGEIHGEYIDGTFFHASGFTCSGCGYDKESTVFSQIFNQYLRYKLYELKGKKKENLPYGATVKTKFKPYFDYGVGVNCYFNLVRFFGGDMKTISSGKTFDVYYLEFKK